MFIFFCNQVVNTTYLVRDLSLIPGFDCANLNLTTYIAAAAQGVKTISSCMIEHQSQQQAATEQVTSVTSSAAVDTFSLRVPAQNHHRNNNNNNPAPSLPPSGRRNQTERSQERGRDQRRNKSPNRTWVHGTDQNLRYK